MAEDNPNRLRFSIEESVWLNNGLEVDEIVSMSLEPDISIVENKHYVSVRGSLRLAGEYRPLPTNGEEKDEPSLQDPNPLQNQSLRPIDELRESEDGTVEIEHSFPVDITIPLSRIDRLEDIYVMVDAFDYTLPNNDCLRLEADISISGMAEEQDNSVEGNETSEADEAIETVGRASEMANGEWEEDLKGSEWEEPFHFEEVRKASEDESDESAVGAGEDRERGPLVEMKSRETEQQPQPYSPVYEQYAESDGNRLYETDWYSDDHPAYDEGSEEESEEESQEETEYSRKEENALYLTKMLTKEEEEFSRMKMCITQRGESLDTIAERYKLPLTQLIRFNRLENEEIREGQILYIPVSS